MTINGAGNHLGRGNFASLIKGFAIVIGVIALACLALAAAELALLHPKATIGMGANISEMTAGPMTAAPRAHSSTNTARDRGDDGGGPTDAPSRECRPEAGVVPECALR